MTEKTHYRKAFNSPYLSSADIVDTVQLTVKCVRLEPDRTKKTKDEFNTAHFVEKEIRPSEPLKPMILNATNSKTLKDITRSPFIDDWNNVPVTVYVDPSVRFGRETVEGLRIAKAQPIASVETLARLSVVMDAVDTDQLTDAQKKYLNSLDVDGLDEQKARDMIQRITKNLPRKADAA